MHKKDTKLHAPLKVRWNVFMGINLRQLSKKSRSSRFHTRRRLVRPKKLSIIRPSSSVERPWCRCQCDKPFQVRRANAQGYIIADQAFPSTSLFSQKKKKKEKKKKKKKGILKDLTPLLQEKDATGI